MEVMLWLTESYPEFRPQPKEALDHPWFTLLANNYSKVPN